MALTKKNTTKYNIIVPKELDVALQEMSIKLEIEKPTIVRKLLNLAIKNYAEFDDQNHLKAIKRSFFDDAIEFKS
ncbi:MAG: hypothetical protein J0G32_07640 [Alphaproteobacteria bacterium]|jgi:hypothetical protein|nr:hypothetical protein [Alphaproteobacteria bacterium]OJV12536.1 MAG: hypothetical protein BGO27_03330 [Alphaproteobacteria bacterium 33-17]